MKNHFDLEDSEFEQQFERCELSPELFNHEAHLRLAWIHIDKYGLENAIDNVQVQIKNYVNQLGATDKYNTTLMVAAIRAVYHFYLKSKSTNFRDLLTEFPRLKTNFRDLMNAHYAIDIFNSERAKKDNIAPDLLPFD